MSEQTKSIGSQPAFPGDGETTYFEDGRCSRRFPGQPGMTIRAYAAIQIFAAYAGREGAGWSNRQITIMAVNGADDLIAGLEGR